ncbi:MULTISPECIES: HPr family phosphocarrier protein [Tissierellales]|jgi:phosphocarrier protein|uniref:Phosphocarrier protein HPr n=1 Tax=Acidilutibacter cellobiosedens TaxID=2507161 RepID=A0A410QF98_9FIRM|nr:MULTISPECIES: HPr family phosphocarrier protein [Tissierellales]MBE6082877.1 HPr family phosphocarrier protein [Tissierellaceae bacterium]QAT62595.1 HPr family phosphocarrier protein [Acidilutibacter cellobiosedens]SCL94015.1 Phosphocarrier protein HPr [Sporanaerobacter sp. PP17-6a]
MYIEKATLLNETGLHARPASLFVKEASKFESDVKVMLDGKEFNAKSIMGVLSMGATKGDTLEIKAEGKDEKEAVKSLVDLIKTKFNE